MSHAKLYARVAQSSLMSAPLEARYVFLMMIPAADKKGRVIGTDERLAAQFAIPLPAFQSALEILTAPDADSGSKLNDGRRLVKISEPRGYLIVNYRAYQGKAVGEPADPEHCPTTPLALAVAAVFGRRPTTPWSEREIASYKRLAKTGALVMEDVELIHRFYIHERAKGEDQAGKILGYHRRHLDTFLANYQGEVDKARSWAVRFPKAAAKPIKTPKDSAPELPLTEPPDFRDWLKIAYPNSNHSLPYASYPPYVRAEYKPQAL